MEERIAQARAALKNFPRQSIFDAAIEEINRYSEEYNCSMYDSFRDFEGEAPTDPWLISALNDAFKIKAPVLVKTHTRHYSKDDMDGGVNYWIYKSEGLSHLTNDEILDKLNIGTHSGGVGRFFKDHAYVNRRKNYIIIDQTWGYDV
jgi:5-formyltetrahydrofolate cyclo-ligase